MSSGFYKAGLIGLVAICFRGDLKAGPYSQALNDPANVYDAPIPGFVGLDGEGNARLDNGQGGFDNPRNYVNPLFLRWAIGWTDYLRADGQSQFNNPSLMLGPVTGDNFDVLSLGDLTAAQIGSGAPVGRVTAQFTSVSETEPIRDLPGADFVVFENGFVSQFNTGGAGIGGIEGELAYVEVSSDGLNFARFPSVSLTPGAVGSYGTLDATNIFNLAGKHSNAFGDSWGTPFDLSGLTNHPLVLNGTVDLNNIRYVRIVDIPGNGSFLDSATPAHPIYDPWITTGSGGFDLEAIGAISISMTFEKWQDLKGLTGAQRGATADPDRDNVPNLIEYAFAMLPTVSDVDLMPSMVRTGTDLAISFRRDVRATDLIVEVLGTNDLRQSQWQTIARSTHGGDFAAVAPFAPIIDDATDSHIASVGVIRREKIHAPAGIHFLKINVTLAP